MDATDVATQAVGTLVSVAAIKEAAGIAGLAGKKKKRTLMDHAERKL